jgi:hypothetical protein
MYDSCLAMALREAKYHRTLFTVRRHLIQRLKRLSQELSHRHQDVMVSLS